MRSDLTVVTINGRDSYEDVCWSVEDNILWVDSGGLTICMPLDNVVCYQYPKGTPND